MFSKHNDEERKDATFYIANKAGIPVWNGDKIEIDKESTGMEVEEREVDSRAISAFE